MSDNGKENESEFADVIDALPQRALRAIHTPLGHGQHPAKDVFVDDIIKRKGRAIARIRTSLLVTLNLSTEKPLWIATGTAHEPDNGTPRKPKGKIRGAMIVAAHRLLDDIGQSNVVQNDEGGGMSVQCFKMLSDRECELFETIHPKWIEDELKSRADACRYCGCSLVDKETPMLHSDICMDCAEREGVK